MSAGYLRYPTINGDRVVFVCQDALFTVDRAGGRARRLAGEATPTGRPVLSPDGTRLAFVRPAPAPAGPDEVHVMPADGGEARRLTYHGESCATVGWDPATGEILYTTAAGQPFAVDWLHAVDPVTGRDRRLELGPASAISYRLAGGARVLCRNGTDQAHWKRYRGGAAGDLLIDVDGSGEFRRLLALHGNLASPCWAGDRVYFLSDHEGVGNVYSCRADGGDMRRHTQQRTWYARHLSGDGARLVYAAAGDIFLLEPGSGLPRRIDVRPGRARTGHRRKTLPASTGLENAALSPDGSAIAVTAHGQVLGLPTAHGADGGDAVRYGGRDGVRYRQVRWLGKERVVAAAADAGPDEYLAILEPGVARHHRLATGDLGRAVAVLSAPGGDRIAVANHRNQLFVVDLTDIDRPDPALVDSGSHDQIADLAWSPDGRWLAYTFPGSAETSLIKVYDVVTGRTRPVTHPVLRDRAPAFDPEGRYLYFLGQGGLRPILDEARRVFAFGPSWRLFAVPLLSDTARSPDRWWPFPEDPTWAATADGEFATAGGEFAGGDAADPPAVLVELPLPAGRYGRVIPGPGPVLLLCSGRPGSGAPGELSRYDVGTGRIDRVAARVSVLDLDADRRTMLCRCADQLHVVPVDAPFPPVGGTAGPGAARGAARGAVRGAARGAAPIELRQLTLSVLPPARWRQMFREAWRLQRDQFWDAALGGVDWARVYRRYRPLVDRVATRAELSDLLAEMHGELGTSHVGEREPCAAEQAPASDSAAGQGFLGADLAYDGERWTIAAIPVGDHRDGAARSPCASPESDIRVGDSLLSVAGSPVGPSGPGELLVGRAGRPVAVTTVRPGGRPRGATVRAVGDERPMRYRSWVAANRRYVCRRAGGRLGYVSIPDTGPVGCAEFFRQFLTGYDRPGLIVDLRFNGGGNSSELIAEALARRRFGGRLGRWRPAEPYPAHAPQGPMVALINEYTGSDGEILAQAFRALGLGPLIGTRTHGCVMGIRPRFQLVDGTVTTQPEFPYVFDGIGGGLENRGVEPDIVLALTPQDHAAGRDPQLVAAVTVMLASLDSDLTPEPSGGQ